MADYAKARQAYLEDLIEEGFDALIRMAMLKAWDAGWSATTPNFFDFTNKENS